jgi:Zn-dependent protease with chaperone function
VASVPLLLLVTSVFLLVIAPAQLALSCHLEHEADRFGLESTQTNHSAGTAFVKLQEDALGKPWPGPMVKPCRANHPPLGGASSSATTIHPWRGGAPLRYATLFRN